MFCWPINVPRIKGNHNAMLSGILAAETVFNSIISGEENVELREYDLEIRKGKIGKDLNPVKNVQTIVVSVWFICVSNFGRY